MIWPDAAEASSAPVIAKTKIKIARCIRVLLDPGRDQRTTPQLHRFYQTYLAAWRKTIVLWADISTSEAILYKCNPCANKKRPARRQGVAVFPGRHDVATQETA